MGQEPLCEHFSILVPDIKYHECLCSMIETQRRKNRRIGRGVHLWLCKRGEIYAVLPSLQYPEGLRLGFAIPEGFATGIDLDRSLHP